jgi:hypothetical protein
MTSLLLQVFGQDFHCARCTTPQVGLPSLSLSFAGQMRERIFHQPLMIAHAFLAHFNDPFCKPFASCHGLSVARKPTTGFLESIPRRVKCRSQNRDRLWIKGTLSKEWSNRHRPSPSRRDRRIGGIRTPPPSRSVVDRLATGRMTLCAEAAGIVGNVDYQPDVFLTDRFGAGEMRRVRGQVDNIRTTPWLGPAGRGW